MSSDAAAPTNGCAPRTATMGFDRLVLTALTALAHRVTLGSIALLLVNDHFLKGQYPSALTGKISDFAGLFFFPFLLAALFGVAGSAAARFLPEGLAGIRILPHKVARAIYLSFAITAMTFAAVKVVPAANSAAAAALEALLRLPVRIVLDPTDLVALAALWPAWKLWGVLARQSEEPPTRRSLLALGLASLAALATAPCPPEQSVSHLVFAQDRVYALATEWQPVSNASVSADGGYWDSIDPETVPTDALDAASTGVVLPKVVCVPRLDRICYRVAGQEQLEASTDGGATWEAVWSAPTTRRPYMQRAASGHGQLLACGKTLDFRANDVLVLGEGPDHTALAALGNEGVLRGRQGEPWKRVSVGSAEATPDRGQVRDLLPPLLIVEETLAAVLAAAAGLWLFSELSWKVHRRPGVSGRSSVPWKVGVAAVVGLLAVMVVVGAEELIAYVVVPLAVTSAFVVYLWTGWLATIRSAADSGKALGALGMSFLGGLMVGLAAWTPFALWVLGIIPGYQATVLVALAASAGVLVLFWRRWIRLQSVAPSS